MKCFQKKLNQPTIILIAKKILILKKIHYEIN